MFGVLLQSLKGQNVPPRVQLTAGAVPMNDVFYRDIKKDQFKLRWLNCLRAFVSRGKNARLLYMGLGNDAHHVYVMNKNTVSSKGCSDSLPFRFIRGGPNDSN